MKAAAAALYAVRSDRGGHPKSTYPLDDDNKLSSASKHSAFLFYFIASHNFASGAATSLKHASPRDLPSYPTAGLVDMESSAGAAASLANANHRPFELWKPDHSVSANKAAVLAKDYRAAPTWHPESSVAGSKAAALAAKDGGNISVWQPQATQAGNLAAGQAMRTKGLSPQLDHGYTADGTRRALLAATGAMSGSRKRSGSSPATTVSYPDAENSAANALSAANFANKPSTKVKLPEKDAATDLSLPINAARIHNAAVTNLSREMYTSHPPVAPEVQEMNRQAGLRAAAVSMAKQMYEIQQKIIEQGQGLEKSDSHQAASQSHNRQSSVMSADSMHQPLPQYANLQEAAQRLAAERLAKLNDEHAAYRNYYGTPAAQQTRLSIRNRRRRKTPSDEQMDQSDEDFSTRAQSEGPLFHDQAVHSDAEKRQKDRDSLLAVAERNVKASLHDIDEKVYAETGKASPAMIEGWEAKANARAKADSEARLVNHGRVHIGGGKYLEQSEIEAIAAKRVQPTLDEITERAEARRARDEQLRLEAMERNQFAVAKAEDDRERSARTKEEWKRFKGTLNSRELNFRFCLQYTEEEKEEAKARKAEEKARKAEEMRLRDEEKRRSKAVAIVSGSPAENPEMIPGPPALDPIPKIEQTSTGGAAVFSKSPETRSESLEESTKYATGKEPTKDRAIKEQLVNKIASTDDLRPETRSTQERDLEPGSVGKPFDDVDNNCSEPQVTSGIDPSLLDPVLRELPAQSKTVVESVPTEESGTVATVGLTNAKEVADRVVSTSIETDTLAKKIAPPITPLQPVASHDLGKSVVDSTVESRGQTNPLDPAKESAKLIKHKNTLDAKIAPLSSVETTISGPSAPKSPKGESKVSSWIKTKFSRRTNKPESAIDHPHPSSNSKHATSSENVGAPYDSHSPPDQPHANVFATTAQESVNTEGDYVNDRDLHAASEQRSHEQGPGDNMSSISSLSDDKSAQEPSSEVQRPGTSSSRGDDFEEARDHFDTEKLAPPAVPRSAGRGSDSPVRDSRFLENL